MKLTFLETPKMSLPKDYRMMEMFRKHNHRNIPALSQEANMAKEEFSTYLKAHFIDTTANSMLRRVEEVRIKVQSEKQHRGPLVKLQSYTTLESFSQTVQKMYNDLQTMVKVEQHIQGVICFR